MAQLVSARLDLAAQNLIFDTTGGTATNLDVAPNVSVSLTINGTSMNMPSGNANRSAVGSEIIISFNDTLRNSMFDAIGVATRSNSTFSVSAAAGLATSTAPSSAAATLLIAAETLANVVGYPPIPVGVFIEGTSIYVAMDTPEDFTQLNPAIGNQGSVGATIVNNGRTPAVTTTDPIPAQVILRTLNPIGINPAEYTETLPSYVSANAIPSPLGGVSITNPTRTAIFERTAITRANTDVTLTLFGDQFAAFWSSAGRGYSGNLAIGNNQVFVANFPGAFAPIVRIEGNLAEGVTARGVFIDTDGVDADSITYTWTRTPVVGTPSTIRTEANTSAFTDNYVVTADDVGSRLDLTVEYTDRRSGEVVTARATTSALITGGEVTGDLTVTATGPTTAQRVTLSAAIENLADPNGLPNGNVYAIEWLIGGTPVRTIQNLPRSLEGSDFVPAASGVYSANLFFVDSGGNREDLLSSNSIDVRLIVPTGPGSNTGIGTGRGTGRGAASRSGRDETKGPSRKANKAIIPIRKVR